MRDVCKKSIKKQGILHKSNRTVSPPSFRFVFFTVFISLLTLEITGCMSQPTKTADAGEVQYVKVGMQLGLSKAEEDAFDSCVEAYNEEKRAEHKANGGSGILFLAQTASMQEVRQDQADTTGNELVMLIMTFGVSSLFSKAPDLRRESANAQQYVGTCFARKQAQLHAR
ncbi:MAG: hypothetical protein AB2787_08200 [Candidatus Thiodiazotropha endolucinida]